MTAAAVRTSNCFMFAAQCYNNDWRLLLLIIFRSRGAYLLTQCAFKDALACVDNGKLLAAEISLVQAAGSLKVGDCSSTLGLHIRLRIVRNVYSAMDTHIFEKGFHRSHDRSHGLVQRAPMDSGSRSLIAVQKSAKK